MTTESPRLRIQLSSVYQFEVCSNPRTYAGKHARFKVAKKKNIVGKIFYIKGSIGCSNMYLPMSNALEMDDYISLNVWKV